MEMSSIRNDDPIIIFYPKVDSVSFDEGIYTDFCKYTINLNTDTLFDKDNNLIDCASEYYTGLIEGTSNTPTPYHIESYSDEWAIEPDESFGKTPNDISPPPNGFNNSVPRIYRLTRNISATGKTMYFPSNNTRQEAWEQAKKYVKNNILKESIGDDPKAQVKYFPAYGDALGSGFLNLTSVSGYNHVRSETINKTDGIYSLSDSWIISPFGDRAVESYSLSISSNTNSPLVTISVNGTIKGLSINNANDFCNNNKYQEAYNKLRSLSNNNFSFDGPNSTIFKRAQNTTPIKLNIIPLSRSITVNQATGEITYNITYNNRPTNFIRNIANENITLTDTYPGDVFSIIPTINSLNGPIIQYNGGRTEYKRDLNIELNVSRSGIGYYKMLNKNSYIYRKPSIDPVISSDILKIVQACSPHNETGIRKYFLNSVSENWDPKSGSYATQISWTYELDK